MNRTKHKRKTTNRSRPYASHLPNPWRILLAKDYPGIPFEKALVLERRRLEKIVAEGMAREALRKALRRSCKSAPQAP